MVIQNTHTSLKTKKKSHNLCKLTIPLESKIKTMTVFRVFIQFRMSLHQRLGEPAVFTFRVNSFHSGRWSTHLNQVQLNTSEQNSIMKGSKSLWTNKTNCTTRGKNPKDWQLNACHKIMKKLYQNNLHYVFKLILSLKTCTDCTLNMVYMQSMLLLKYKMWRIPIVLHIYYDNNCNVSKQFLFMQSWFFSIC